MTACEHAPEHNGVSLLLDRVKQELRRGLLPAEIFSNDAIFHTEMRRIFAQSWIFLAFEAEIPASGDYVQRFIGRDSVIVSRDNKGQISVLANFCRHRGTKLCQSDRGNQSHFRCPYHGWVFRNNGDWIGAPDKSQAYSGIDSHDWDLLRAPRVDTFLGMIFASLDPDAPELETYLRGAGWILRGMLDLHPGGMVPIAPPDRFRVRADWKTGAENFGGDIYHVAVTHGSVQSIGMAQGLDQLNGYSTQYVLGDGHSFLGHDFDRLFGEAGHFWFYPDRIRDQFDLSRIDPLLQDVMRKNSPIVGNVFPNLSFLRFFGAPSIGEPPAVYTTVRQWQPIGPGEVELWTWQLKWAFMDDAEADASYRAGLYGFGPGGIFEQDDVVLWEGAPQVARSVWAQREQVSFNMQMGLDGIGRQTAAEDWDGPGKIYRPGPGEPSQRAFYDHWVDRMREDAR